MLKASRKSRRVLLAGATGIMALTVAGLGVTASGAAAEQIRTVTTTSVTTLAAQVAPVTPPAAPAIAPTEPTPPAPPARVNKVVIVKDGKTATYEGAEADAFLDKNPEFRAGIDEARDDRPGTVTTRRIKRLTIRGKDGKVRTFEGDAADAYLRDHPEARPPLPPLPPIAVGAVAPPPPGGWGGKAPPRVAFLRTDGTGPRNFAVNVPEVIDGKCPDGAGSADFVRNETRNGKQRIIICRAQIQRFADAQARSGMAQARAGIMSARAAIMADRNLSDAQRQQALVGLDQAQAGLDTERK